MLEEKTRAEARDYIHRLTFRSEFMRNAGIVAAFFITAMFVVFKTPPNMDETIQYHSLACVSHPLSEYHSFREPCDGSYDLNVLGQWLPMRSYHYVGASSGLIYYPVFKLFPSYLSARLVGLFFLVLVAVGVSRLVDAPPMLALGIVGINLPMMYQMISDTGPVGYQLVAMVWVPIAVRGLAKAKSAWRFAFLSIVVGLFLFIAIEQKAFFFVVVPSMLLTGITLAVLSMIDERQWARKVCTAGIRLIPAAVLTATLSLLLFRAEVTSGGTYWSLLQGHSDRFSVTDLTGQAGHLFYLARLYFLDLSSFGNRVYAYGEWVSTALTLCYWGVVLLVMIHGAVYFRKKMSTPEVALTKKAVVLLAASALALALINFNRNSAAGHHLIFAFPFLLAAIVLALNSLNPLRLRNTCIVAMCLLQILLVASLLQRTPRPESAWERLDMFKLAGQSPFSDSIVVHLDWGTYYLHALYAPAGQLVMYAEPLNETSELEKILSIGSRLNKKLSFIVRAQSASDFGMVRKRIPELKRMDEALGIPGSDWEFWSTF